MGAGEEKFAGCVVVVPAFNEARALPAVLADLSAELPGAQIVVVDDGSTDETSAAVRPPHHLLRLPFNLGIGGAMQTGYRFAIRLGAQVIVQVDGDGQHPAAEVEDLVAPVLAGDADLTLGSRFLRASQYRQTPTRGLGAAWLHAAIRLATGQWVTDCTSGFRAVSPAVATAFATWYPDDYPEPQVLTLLLRAGARVREVPVRMRQRAFGRSSISLADGAVYLAKVTIAIFLDLFRSPWSDSLQIGGAAFDTVDSAPAPSKLEGPSRAERQPVPTRQ